MTPSLLGDLHLFSEVDLQLAARLLTDVPRRRIEAGQVILRPGKDNDTLYIILEGKFEVLLSERDQQELVTLERGDCVGEMSVIDDSPACAMVRAQEDCEVLALDRRTAWRLIEAHPPFARNLLRVLARRLRSDNQRIMQEQRQREKFERFSLLDDLTGLYNRRWLDLALAETVAAYHRDGRPFCLLMIDLDHFKLLNDTHGHQAGDQCLRQVARVIRGNLRPLDQAARFGGEEFAIILPGVQREEAMIAAERLRRAVAEAATPPQPGVTISLGVAEAVPKVSPTSLIQAADEALYRAKQGGRDQVAC